MNFKCMDAYFHEGKIWTIDNFGYSLCSLDLDNWKLNIEEIISQQYPLEYRKIIQIKRMLFFVKNNGKEIVKYDLQLHKGYIYKRNSDDEYEIMHIFIYYNKIIMIPLYIYNEIYLFDIEKCQFETMECQLNLSHGDAFVPSAVLLGDKIWFITNKGTVIRMFDLFHQESDAFYLPKDICVGGLCFDGEEFIFISTIGYKVYKWKPDMGIIVVYHCDNITDHKDAYAKVIACNGEIYAISRLTDGIYKVDMEMKKVKMVCRVKRDEIDDRNALFMETMIIGNRIIVLPWRSESFIDIDCEKNKVVCHKVLIEKNIYRNCY